MERINEPGVESKEEIIEVVRITPDDWEAYRDIRIDSLKNDPDSFEKDEHAILEASNLPEEYWRNLIAGNEQNQFRIYGIFKDGKIITTASISLEPKDEYSLSYVYNNTRPTIDRVYTRPEYRNMKKGYGKKVMEKILSVAKNEMKLPFVFLDVNKTKEAAIGFYTNMGFVLTHNEIKVKDKDGNYVRNTEEVEEGSDPDRVFEEMRKDLNPIVAKIIENGEDIEEFLERNYSREEE